MEVQTLIQDSGSYLSDAFQGVSNQMVMLLPKVVLAVVVIVAGWFLAVAAAEAVSRVMKSLKVDNALKHVGVDQIVSKTGHDLDSGYFLGWLVKALIIVIFLITSLEIVGLNRVTVLLGDLVMSILPNLIVVVVLLIAAAVLADVARKFVTASAKASGVPSAAFLGELTKGAIWLFAVLLSLIQFNIGATTLNTLFLGIVVTFALAFGLAFGLGGKDVASKILEKWYEGMDK